MKIKANKIISIALLFSLLFVVSCNKDVVYTQYKKFEDNQWFVKDKAVFEVDITDNNSLNNISLMVRHADNYPYSNLFLFVVTTYPDGKAMKDTMEIILANEKGEWLGSGAGDIFDFKTTVVQNSKFTQKGKYTFEFQQAMRTDPLPLIMDFGFEIEKAK